jgi:hypothetical protein
MGRGHPFCSQVRPNNCQNRGRAGIPTIAMPDLHDFLHAQQRMHSKRRKQKSKKQNLPNAEEQLKSGRFIPQSQA